MTEIINRKSIASRLYFISEVSALLTLLTGIIVIAGWIVNIPLLKSLHPDFVSMKFNTALSFFLSGLSALIIHRFDGSTWLKRTGLITVSFIMAVSFLTLYQYIWGINLGIDEIFVKDSPDALYTFSSGRMALNTSFCFILAGTALMFAFFKKNSAAQILALFLFLFNLTGLLGYLYNVPEVYGFSVFTKMALHTITGFIFLSISILFSFPEKGYLAAVIDETIGGYIARRILPVAVLLPVFLVAIRLTVEQSGFFSRGEDIQVIASLLIVVFLGLAWSFLDSIRILDKEQKAAQVNADEWRDLMNYVIQYNPGAIAVHDNNLRYIFVSERYLSDYNLNDRNIIGKHHYEVFPEIPEKWRDVHRRALNGEIIRSNDDDFFIRGDGSVEHTRWECRPWYGKGGSIGGIILYTEVITKRKLVEKELRNTVNQLNMVLDSAGDGIFAVDREGKAVLVNRAASEMMGFSESELLGRVIHLYHHHTRADGSSFPREECPVYRTFSEGKPFKIDYDLFWKSDGTPFPVEYTCNPVKDDNDTIGAVVSFRDIASRIKAEDRIISSLYEKENLLREIFHRTNNNMLLIQSMLLFQSSRYPDLPLPEFVDIIIQRIDAMALVHKKLYASKNLSSVDLGEYLSELASIIPESRPSDFEKVDILLDLDRVKVLFDTAVPVGLIVHELIVNAVKYAFTGNDQGKVYVSLRVDNEGLVELAVSDTGSGGGNVIDPENLTSVGLPLVYLLAKDQLQGTIDLDQSTGMRYTIKFKDNLYEARV